ncbi:MAG TPA: FumA C-terminus/TtdB family hydratase beta subunit [Dehalococcoidia bacterium]|nr:FumA C-terminus/TtdB family hydratase beta subunit [Dehalococcoidia bacterium]
MVFERISDLEVRITTPLTEADVTQLKIGDHVRVPGVIYTARDAAHNRMIETLDAGGTLPIDLKGQLIYYTGPTPARPGRASGAFGPTTSMRMDPFTPRLLAAGLKACMGKGNRGPEVQAALKQYRAVYLMAVGGAGAMLSQFIRKVEVVAYEDLGTESLKRVEVEDFPAVVMDDSDGRDLLMEGRKQWRDMSKLGNYKPSEKIVISAG